MLIYTKHIKDRMEELYITKEDVEYAIARGKPFKDGEATKIKCKENWVCVVAVEKYPNIILLTTYKF